MPKAFVTGATGFLGRHFIDVLAEAGWEITALVRDKARARTLLGDRADYVGADLADAGALQGVIPDACDAVFHIAADTSTWAYEKSAQDRVNITGTKALLEAARHQSVGRFIHVSSFAVYGIHHSTITEESDQKGRGHWVNYVRSKTAAEDAVRAAVAEGMNAVIVNPGHIVGAYDDHNWARMIRFVDRGDLPGIPPGSGNFANGRKVAEAVLSAYTQGRTGENYILAGPREDFTTFVQLVADKLGKPVRAKPRPAWLLKTVAALLGLISNITGKRPLMTPEEAYFSCEDMVASSDKAVRELGYEVVPLSQSLDQAIAYLRQTGAIEKA